MEGLRLLLGTLVVGNIPVVDAVVGNLPSGKLAADVWGFDKLVCLLPLLQLHEEWDFCPHVGLAGVWAWRVQDV